MSLSHATSKRWRVVRAVLLLMLFAGVPLVMCERRLANLNMTSGGGAPGGVLSRAEFEKIIVRLDKQKDQRSQWAYTALVAIVAISVVKRVFKIPWIRFAYVLVGTAGVLMFESIRAGDEYERRVASLVLAGSVSEASFNSLNDFLWTQRQWLNYAAVVLLVFVGAFLTAVLSNNVLTETKTDEKQSVE